MKNLNVYVVAAIVFIGAAVRFGSWFFGQPPYPSLLFLGTLSVDVLLLAICLSALRFALVVDQQFYIEQIGRLTVNQIPDFFDGADYMVLSVGESGSMENIPLSKQIPASGSTEPATTGNATDLAHTEETVDAEFEEVDLPSKAKEVLESTAFRSEIVKETIAAAGSLIRDIPERMQLRKAVQVEIRMGMSGPNSIAPESMLQGLSASAITSRIEIVDAMMVQMRSHPHDFRINALSEKAQYVRPNPDFPLANQLGFGLWRFDIMPTQLGRRKLYIDIACVAFGAGPGIICPLPAETIEITVEVNKSAAAIYVLQGAAKLLLWLLGAIIVAMIGAVTQDLWLPLVLTIYNSQS